MTPPQVETPNILRLDIADNVALREIFSRKEAGSKCRLTLELEIMSKTPQMVEAAIEKVITDPSDYHTDEATPSLKEPIMATISRRKGKDMPMGKHNRPPQTAENSAEPSMLSYT